MSDVDDIDTYGLNPKQVQFCREYIIDMNATQAYIRAGYAENGANKNAANLMANHGIQALVTRFARDRALRTITEADQVVSQLARMAMGDIRKIFTASGKLKRIEDLDDDTAAAIQSVKVTQRPAIDEDGERSYEDVVEYKMVDKKGPLELLGKHMKMWAELEQPSDTAAEAMLELARRLPD